MPTLTTNLSMSKPDIGQTAWGGLMNANLDALDALFPSGKLSLTKLTVPLVLADGTVAAPTYSFSSNTGTGMYKNGTGIEFAYNGVVAARVDTGTGVIVPSNNYLAWGSAGVGSVDTLLRRSAAGAVTFGTNTDTSGGTANARTLGVTASGTATSGANFNSGSIIHYGSYWNGSAAAIDSWNLQNVLGTGANPSSTLTLVHTGSTGTAGVSLPQLQLSAAGSAAVGKYGLLFTNRTSQGIYCDSTTWSFAGNTTNDMCWFGNGLWRFQSGASISFASGDAGGTSGDVNINRNATGVLAIGAAQTGGSTGRLKLAAALEGKATVAPSAGAITLDVSTATTFLVTLNANVTSVTISNPTDGQVINIMWRQDATGSRTVTMPTSLKGATAPSAGANTTSAQAFVYDSANSAWYSLGAASTGM